MSFSKAMEGVLVSEGGYANDPQDEGGETYCGIARKFFPDWEGWRTIDQIKGRSAHPIRNNTKFVDPNLDKSINLFYLVNFWNPLKCDDILNPVVADHLFDCGINFGRKSAVKFLQLTCNGFTRTNDLIVDGLIGPKTIGAINQFDDTFSQYMVRARIELYFDKCEVKPYKYKYLKGWCLRSLKYLGN